MTVAPPQRASRAAIEPTAPSAPWTRTVLPATEPSPKGARCAVIPGIPRHAPISSLTSSGSGTACSPGTRVSSAAVPNGRYDCAPYTHTLSDAAPVHALPDGVDDAG